MDSMTSRISDFLDVGRSALGNFSTRRTATAGLVGRSLLTVQAARDQASEGGLADATRTRQQDRVGNAIATDRVAQCRCDMALARDFVEALRTPFTRDDLIAQSRLPISSLRMTSNDFEAAGLCRGLTAGLIRSQPSPCCGCFLPDLTGFTGSRTRAGPCGQCSAQFVRRIVKIHGVGGRFKCP